VHLHRTSTHNKATAQSAPQCCFQIITLRPMLVACAAPTRLHRQAKHSHHHYYTQTYRHTDTHTRVPLAGNRSGSNGFLSHSAHLQFLDLRVQSPCLFMQKSKLVFAQLARGILAIAWRWIDRLDLLSAGTQCH
jgi:hypothetical protein